MEFTPIPLHRDFGSVSREPTQIDEATGIRYDFNLGARYMLPEGLWDIRISNSENGDIYLEEKMPGGTEYSFPWKYYIPYEISFYDAQMDRSFHHRMNLKDKKVAIKIMQKTLGDPLYLMAAVNRFVGVHGCNAVVYASPRIAEILNNGNSRISFRPLEEEDVSLPYATYYLGLFFDQNVYWQPYDFRTYSLIQQGQHILGLPDTEILHPPRVNPRRYDMPGKPPYIAISYSGSKQCKVWNNPTGWYETIQYIKSIGYTPVCIDRDPVFGLAPIYNVMPPGVIDMTGNRPLQERIDVLNQCSCFIGTPSGLAALAWCVGIPVVMISGFSLPFAEFPCHRVINPMVNCKGCWNDTRIDFNAHEMHWCPRIDPLLDEAKKDYYTIAEPAERKVALERVRELEKRKFVCTRAITSNQVIAAVNRALSGSAP